MELLAERYDIHLYTRSDEIVPEGIRRFPEVSQMTGGFKIFYSSKINLNITMRSIESGVPWPENILSKDIHPIIHTVLNTPQGILFLYKRSVPVLITLYYLPLAADVAWTESLVITDEEIRKYGCDMSFVGSLYSNNIYDRYSERFSDEAGQIFSEIMERSAFQWDGQDRLGMLCI